MALARSGAFGEWLYNLRASLDYIIWAAAAFASGTLPPPNEEVLQYPIYDNEAAWKANLYRWQTGWAAGRRPGDVV